MKSKKSDSPLDWEEFRKAKERISTLSGGVLQWIVQFANYDLGKLSTGDWINLRTEVKWFTLGMVSEPSSGMFPRGNWSTPASQKDVESNFPSMEMLEWRVDDLLPSIDAVKHLWAVTHKHLDELVDQKVTMFTFSEQTDRVLRFIRFIDGMKGIRVITTGNPTTVFLYNLSDLLSGHGDRLRRCRECQNLFCATRTDQEFCGNLCQGRAGVKRFRAAKKQGKAAAKRGRPPKIKTTTSAKATL